MAVPWALAMLPVQRERHVRLLSNVQPRKTPRCLLLAHGRRLPRCSEVGSCPSRLARPRINLHTRWIDDGVAYVLPFEQTVSQ